MKLGKEYVRENGRISQRQVEGKNLGFKAFRATSSLKSEIMGKIFFDHKAFISKTDDKIIKTKDAAAVYNEITAFERQLIDGGAVIAKFFLHETVTTSRWIGVLLISAGVGFVTQGPALTHHPAKAKAQEAAYEPASARPEP